MKHVHKLLCLGFLPVAVAAWAAGPADDPHTPAPPATASGVYSISFQLTNAVPVPTGATVTCKAKIVPRLPISGEMTQPVAAVGSPAGCSLQVPYAWRVSQGQGGAAISYEVDAVAQGGAIVRSASKAVGVNLPPAGGVARLTVPVSF